MGNITQIRKNGVIINEYTYDSLGQLTCEEDAVAGKTYIYYYDKSGNITQKDSYPFAEGATRGDYISYIASQKETVSTYIYNNSTWGDLLGVYNGKIILYDAIGNPLKWRNAVGLTWDARELQRVDLSTNSYVNYTYNSDGIRTSRSYVDFNTQYSEERNYILDGNKIIQEDITISTITALTNATLYYLYDETGSIQGFIYNNQHYYFQKNLQGDVIRILNNYGDVVTEYTYDAWGKILTTTGSLASTVGKYNPFRYRSYYYDTETGFYYLQSRYYDPVVGRFLNADHPELIGANGGIQGYNMFAYCNNNPVMYADDNGYALLPCTVLLYDSGHIKKETNESDQLADSSDIVAEFNFCSFFVSLVYDTLGFPSETMTSDLVGTLGPYNELKKLTKGNPYLEVHHLIEARFYVAGGVFSKYSRNNAPSVVVTKAEHQALTNGFRAHYPYGKTNYTDMNPSSVLSYFGYEYTSGGKPDWWDYICSCYD